MSQNYRCVQDLLSPQKRLQCAGALPASLAAVCSAVDTKGLKAFASPGRLCYQRSQMALPAAALFPAPWSLLKVLPPLPGSAPPTASSTTVSSPSLSRALCLANQWFSSDRLGPLVPHSDTFKVPDKRPLPFGAIPVGLCGQHKQSRTRKRRRKVRKMVSGGISTSDTLTFPK